jgi:hypothetical protein|tara:strand:+ start:5424 stop:5579 length:156 start_codon:yes stop_codon:yes gene_type:complete
MSELEMLQKMLEEKKSDIEWVDKKKKQHLLELEMIQNRITLIQQVNSEGNE